ncbi:KilA-N domain-containing protein [Achromobacter denitrificans]|nr:KilA-N domain-containing protein [Achromobacter denitrificans]
MSEIILRVFDGNDVQFDERGWMNATTVARRHGREPNDWLVQRETADYLAELAAEEGNSRFVREINEIKELPSTSSVARVQLLKMAKASGFLRTKAGPVAHGGGTWLHPDLVVLFARWISAKFALWSDRQIKRILMGAVAQPDPNALSTVADREPLYLGCVRIMVKHRLPLPVVYQGINDYVGTKRFADMTLAHVPAGAAFLDRMLSGTDSGADWRRVEANRLARLGHASQSKLDLGPLVLGSYRSREVTHA